MNLLRLLVLVALIAATATLASAKSVIQGTLRGDDGRPMPLAHIHLLSADGKRTLDSVQASPSGAYRLETEAKGYLQLQFTGVSHKAKSVPLFLELPGDVSIDVKLATRLQKTPDSTVSIMGEFNDFEFSLAQTMQRLDNGTYTIEIPFTGKTMAYQIVLSDPATPDELFSMNGTSSASFVYDGAGDYRSVIDVKGGKATIVFDPRKLPICADEAVVSAQNPQTQMFIDLVDAMNDRRTRYRTAMSAYMASGESTEDFEYTDSTIALLLSRITAEQNPLTRRLLLVSYLASAASGTELDSELVVQSLRELTPTDLAWSVRPYALPNALRKIAGSPNADAYMWDAVSNHPDTNFRLTLISAQTGDAFYSGDTARLRTMYNRLMADFPESNASAYARATYNPDRRIQKGHRVPAFKIASLQNPSDSISDASMQGGVYLLDFWATWCGPCVAEMANLHTAYEKFKPRGLEIVSLSFDGSPDAIARFRIARYAMPWMHAFVEGNFNSQLATDFEVLGIPKPILVSADGIILAAGVDLRGKNLEKTLERVLGSAQ